MGEKRWGSRAQSPTLQPVRSVSVTPAREHTPACRQPGALSSPTLVLQGSHPRVGSDSRERKTQIRPRATPKERRKTSQCELVPREEGHQARNWSEVWAPGQLSRPAARVTTAILKLQRGDADAILVTGGATGTQTCCSLFGYARDLTRQRHLR
jgi:hypothetical protein